MTADQQQTSAGATLARGLCAAAFIAAIVWSGLYAGLWHDAGLYYLLCGSVAAALMGFSWREIAGAFRLAADRPGSPGELIRAAYFWEAAARNAWILGVLGSALNFTIALGFTGGGLQDISSRMIRAYVVGLYGMVLAVLCITAAVKIQGRLASFASTDPSDPLERQAVVSETVPAYTRTLGYVLFALVLATAGYSLVRGESQGGPLTLDKVLLHWPAILVVVGGTAALAIFMGAGAGARALTLGFALTGLISLLMGFIQALFGFVHQNIREISAALVFVVSASSFALLGMLVAGAPLEDREVMEGRRGQPGSLSRLLWVVFPLLAYLFLILAFIIVITPMKQTV